MFRLGKLKEIESVVFPKELNLTTYIGDIALIKLKIPFNNWDQFVQPACLPTSELVYEYAGKLMVSTWVLV